MARVTPEEYQEKLARNLKASTTDMVRGVERVAQAPSAAAIAQKDVMVNNYNESVRDGKWEKNLSKVTKEDWQKSMKEKGIPRIAAGIDAAKAKTIESATVLLKNVDTVQAEVKRMPKGTMQNSADRMLHAMNRMHELSKK